MPPLTSGQQAADKASTYFLRIQNSAILFQT